VDFIRSPRGTPKSVITGASPNPYSNLNTNMETAIFGVDLELAVKRSNHIHELLPDVIYKCFIHLREKGPLEEGIFRLTGSVSEIKKIRDAFDEGHDYDIGSILNPHTVAGILKLFIREAPQRFIPTTWSWSEVRPKQELHDMVKQLTPSYHCFLSCLIKLLCTVSHAQEVTKMGIPNLVIVFSAAFQCTGSFLGHLINYAHELFPVDELGQTREKVEEENKIKREKERLEREEKERLEREREREEREEKERANKERAEGEKTDKERAEREKADKERAEKEREQKEKRDRKEKKRAKKERAEYREKEERDRTERERIEREREEREEEINRLAKVEEKQEKEGEARSEGEDKSGDEETITKPSEEENITEERRGDNNANFTLRAIIERKKHREHNNKKEKKKKDKEVHKTKKREKKEKREEEEKREKTQVPLFGEDSEVKDNVWEAHLEQYEKEEESRTKNKEARNAKVENATEKSEKSTPTESLEEKDKDKEREKEHNTRINDLPTITVEITIGEELDDKKVEKEKEEGDLFKEEKEKNEGEIEAENKKKTKWTQNTLFDDCDE